MKPASSARSSPLQAYQGLTVGDGGLLRLLAYEALTGLLGPLPGALGLLLRRHGYRGLFAAAGRVLRPGGELWCVYNSHLPHREALRRLVGPTRQISRDPVFTVTAATRSGAV